MAADFDGRALGGKAGAAAPGGQSFLDHVIGELIDPTAALADRESREAGVVLIGMSAGDESIERFEAVREDSFHQLVERSINLQQAP